MRIADKVSASEATPLPGCAQVVVSHNAFIRLEFRGRGEGRLAMGRRLDKLRSLGYDVHGWGLGRNVGPTAAIVKGLEERLVTLYERHGVKVSDLRKWNNLSGNMIRSGQRLKDPARAELAKPGQIDLRPRNLDLRQRHAQRV